MVLRHLRRRWRGRRSPGATAATTCTPLSRASPTPTSATRWVSVYSTSPLSDSPTRPLSKPTHRRQAGWVGRDNEEWATALRACRPPCAPLFLLVSPCTACALRLSIRISHAYPSLLSPCCLLSVARWRWRGGASSASRPARCTRASPGGSQRSSTNTPRRCVNTHNPSSIHTPSPHVLIRRRSLLPLHSTHHTAPSWYANHPLVFSYLCASVPLRASTRSVTPGGRAVGTSGCRGRASAGPWNATGKTPSYLGPYLAISRPLLAACLVHH